MITSDFRGKQELIDTSGNKIPFGQNDPSLMQNAEESKELIAASNILRSLNKRYEQAKQETIKPLQDRIEQLKIQFSEQEAILSNPTTVKYFNAQSL